MLGDVVEFLECPICRGALTLQESTVRCTSEHAFDVARQGYVNLLVDGPPSGDTAAMVSARAAFLEGGHYDPLVRAVQAYTSRALVGQPGCVLDIGAGTGRYLAAALELQPTRVGVATDVSKYAARRAARGHPRSGAIVCDVWRGLPVRDGAAALVLDVFAPRNAREIRRVLGPGGVLLMVTPTERHLAELVAELDLLRVDERKAERLDDRLGPYLIREQTINCEFTMWLGRDDVTNLVGMGPSAWHTDPDALRQRVGALPEPFPVTASVALTGYHR